ncbi:acetyl-CoA carboxylase biotin carboxyl carrier protein [candidate division KSB1 bacterium]|jgi:acetyl-CoA carboxylase biotin carboxyl carrier protein|nr:acetyl-CoA carboxylase biotin carboxyl carrier protein [candidate division KSB1 bacterium]
MRENKIRELVRIVQDSDIDELEVRTWWGKRVRIKKTAANISENTAGVIPVSAASPIPQAPATVVPSEPVKAPSVTPEKSETEVKSEPKSNLLEIKAPMVGTFYSSPAPDAEPYIKVGDVISPGQVLCIIEAMKLMNEIESEMSGRIVEVLCKNAQSVEYNQTLFLVEPSNT